MKPRIWFAGGHWWCGVMPAPDFVGVGNTPEEAYMWWVVGGRNALVVQAGVPAWQVAQ